MEDYYTVVGVDRTAAAEEIDRKVREQLRIWQRRTTNADLSRRQEAERRVQLLGEARAILLDAEKRRRYDGELAGVGGGAPGPDPTGEPGEPDVPGEPAAGSASSAAPRTPAEWLAAARRHLARNDYRAAAHAARQARNAPHPSAEAWGALARASAGLGNLDDARYEARQAVAAEPDSAQAHLDLAHVYEARREWHLAFEAYERASKLDPQAEAAEVGMARSLAASTGNPIQAVNRLERRYARALPAQRAAAGRLLGHALVGAAEQQAKRPGGGYWVMTPERIRQLQWLLNRARQVTSDPEVLRSVIELEQVVAGSQVRRGAGAGRPLPPAPPVGPAGVPGRPLAAGPTNQLAVAALVCSLSGLMLWITAPIGAVLGHVARQQIRVRDEAGDGMALAGIVVGWLMTGLMVGGFVFLCGLGP